MIRIVTLAGTLLPPASWVRSSRLPLSATSTSVRMLPLAWGVLLRILNSACTLTGAAGAGGAPGFAGVFIWTGVAGLTSPLKVISTGLSPRFCRPTR